MLNINGMTINFENWLKFCSFFVKILFIWLFCISWFCFGYEQEWFLKYQEWDEWIFFECEEKCTIMLWERGSADVLIIKWFIEWTGTIDIFGKKWDKEYSLYKDKLSFTWNAYVEFPNYERILYSIPRNWYLLMQLSWNLEWNFNIDKKIFSYSQKLLMWWEDFWKMEILDQMSVMKRTWVSIRWTSIVVYGYIIFIVVAIIVLFLKEWKKQKFGQLFYLWLWLFLFIWLRNTVTYTYILDEWLSEFRKNQTFFDFRDYIPFINKVRDRLNLQNFEKNDCKIFLKVNDYNWAIDLHRDFFLSPCKSAFSPYSADYIMYYDMDIEDEDRGKEILLEYSWSYLLNNNLK